jgi:4,5-DOPA dioxygenase extradiol
MWVPLKGLFPKADIPVLGLSIPGLSPEYLYEFGKRLSPLRNEGVLILCSGGMTHNLGDLNFQEAAPPESWAVEFDQWVVGRLLARDVRSLLKFDTQAPFSHKAHPSTEHFAPLFISLGAGEGSLSEISFPVSGFRWGTLSMRSVQFG